MKRFVIAIVTVLAALSVPSARAQTPLFRQEAQMARLGETQGKARAEAEYSKIESRIPMRDGISLFTSIYYPKDTLAKHPILMIRTPYSCSPYGSEFPEQFNTHYYGTYILEGYILVFQDVRGRYLSEGHYEQVRPIDPSIAADHSRVQTDEATDTYDTIEWLLENVPGNNGKVGLTGCSYPGFYAFAGALSCHPAVKAVSPQAPVTDWFMGDDIHHNGALCLSDAFSFIPGMDRHEPPATTYSPMPSFIKEGQNAYDFFLSVGCVDSLTNVLGSYGKGFWKDIMDHPDYDSFWKERNTLQHCGSLSPAVLVVGGEFDAEDLYGAVNLYKTIRKNCPHTDCRFAFGPWKHGGWLGSPVERYDRTPNHHYFFSMELPFFNYYLKGEGSPDAFPRTLVFDTGSDIWNEYDNWPAASSRCDVFLELQPKSALSIKKKSSKAVKTRKKAIAEYVSDPSRPIPSYRSEARKKAYMYEDQSFLADRSDTAPFQSGILESDLALQGPVNVQLTVSSSSTDADFIVKLIDVDSTGLQRMVRCDIMPARFRKGFEKPEALKPGKKTDIRFTMADICHSFLKGHRVMVVVQSSSFPLFAMNPQTFTPNVFKCPAELQVPSTITIYGGFLRINSE